MRLACPLSLSAQGVAQQSRVLHHLTRSGALGHRYDLGYLPFGTGARRARGGESRSRTTSPWG